MCTIVMNVSHRDHPSQFGKTESVAYCESHGYKFPSFLSLQFGLDTDKFCPIGVVEKVLSERIERLENLLADAKK